MLFDIQVATSILPVSFKGHPHHRGISGQEWDLGNGLHVWKVGLSSQDMVHLTRGNSVYSWKDIGNPLKVSEGFSCMHNKPGRGREGRGGGGVRTVSSPFQQENLSSNYRTFQIKENIVILGGGG